MSAHRPTGRHPPIFVLFLWLKSHYNPSIIAIPFEGKLWNVFPICLYKLVQIVIWYFLHICSLIFYVAFCYTFVLQPLYSCVCSHVWVCAHTHICLSSIPVRLFKILFTCTPLYSCSKTDSWCFSSLLVNASLGS